MRFGYAPLRERLRSDLAARVAWAAGAIAALFITIVALAAYSSTRELLTRSVHRTLRGEAQSASAYMGGRLRSLTATLASLAEDPRIVATLSGSATHHPPLSPVLQDFSNLGGVQTLLTVTDAQGRLLASNDAWPTAPDLARWARRVAAHETPEAGIRHEHAGVFLRVAQPLVDERSQQVEGLLVAKLPLTALVPSGAEESGIRSVALRYRDLAEHTSKELLLAGIHAHRKGEASLTAQASVPLGALLPPLEFTIRVAAAPTALSTPLARLTITFILAGASLLALVVAVSRRVAQRLTGSLRTLERVAHDVAQQGLGARRVPVDGSDEVARLAVSFNRMLGRLSEAHRLLEEKAEEARSIMDGAMDAIVTVDECGIIESFNRAAECTFGRDAAAMRGAALGGFLEEFQGRPRDEFLQYLHAQYGLGASGAAPVEATALRADGDKRALAVTIGRMHRRERERFVIAMQDITPLRLAERAARAAEARYSSMVEEQTELVVRALPDGTCTFANNAYCSQFGKCREEITGRDFLAALPARDRERLRRLVASLTPADPLTTHLQQLRLGPSDVRWYEWTLRGFFDEERLREIQAIGRNVTELRKLSAELSYQASHDALTGLMNRQEFERRLERALTRGRRCDPPHALCYLDLDRFRVVNDTCGHRAGDDLLRQMGGLLQTRVRRHDLLARLSGDHFAVLLRACPPDKALEIAESLRKAVKTFQFLWRGQRFDIGASIGLVELTPGGATVEEALSTADLACYMAKELGRDRVQIYHPSDVKTTGRRTEMAWVSRISDAIEADRLVLYRQSIVPVQRDAPDVAHFEVLVRMQDEDGSLVSPGIFIPAAERFGLMPSVDRWVVARTIDAWSRAREEALRYAINLSGASLADDDLLQFICERLAEHRVPAGSLCFEVTETAAVANLARAVRFLEALKDRGCLVALDDFGCGLSSFAYLKHLPADFLKIDGGFIKDLPKSPTDQAMVEAINQVGHRFGMKTVAEFVENEEILVILRTIGVDYAQGYGIDRPQPLRCVPTPAEQST